MTAAAPTAPTAPTAEVAKYRVHRVARAVRCCPRCAAAEPAWGWKELERPEDQRDALIPVYRCPTCRFVFALRPVGPAGPESERE